MKESETCNFDSTNIFLQIFFEKTDLLSKSFVSLQMQSVMEREDILKQRSVMLDL